MTTEKKNDEFEALREKLRSALPPMKDAEPRRDLWPQLLKRMERGRGEASTAGVPWTLRLPWFDWALLGLAGAAMAFFPALIPVLLYHL
jgi:hypothetical protein